MPGVTGKSHVEPRCWDSYKAIGVLGALLSGGQKMYVIEHAEEDVCFRRNQGGYRQSDMKTSCKTNRRVNNQREIRDMYGTGMQIQAQSTCCASTQ